MLAHGGAQIQINQTMAALTRLGVETDYLRWWDEAQTGDVLHHFGGLPVYLSNLARAKGWKVVNTVLFGEACNRSAGERLLRAFAMRTVMAAPLPGHLKSLLPGSTYREPDRIVVGLEAERQLLQQVYGLASHSVAVVPLGLTEAYLNVPPASRTADRLICSGTIAPVKHSLELARLALQAQVPILFVGKPFAPASRYWQEFQRLVDGRLVKHHAHISSVEEMIAQYRQARAFVLMSRFENWCLAAHEAAACGLPALLPDLPWARERFGDQARYFPKRSRGAASTLRTFYDESPSLPAPKIRLYNWTEVAEILRELYSRLLNSSR